MGKQNGYDGSLNQDGSFSLTTKHEGAAGVPLEHCNMLTAGEETHSSATSSSGREDTAGTSNGLIAYLNIVDIDSGTPTVIIEDSDDNASGDPYTTALSFAAVADGAEPTGERVTVTGAIKKWLRATSTGTFTNLDFVLATRRGLTGDRVDLS
ncbi:MAG: hypothetical protein IIC21_11745 [Chloroflexi bacterium]|nr:hypothetical protein [Chloroflexota bacterium]